MSKDKFYCECEHGCHFRESVEFILSPKGEAGHAYGKEFNATERARVKTTRGYFEVCETCAQDCIPPVQVDCGFQQVY